MIIYATKQTIERYKLKMPEDCEDPVRCSMAENLLEREKGDRLLEWGAKLFYFDRRLYDYIEGNILHTRMLNKNLLRKVKHFFKKNSMIYDLS